MATGPAVSSIMGRSVGVFFSSPGTFLFLALLLLAFRSSLHLSTLSFLSSISTSTVRRANAAPALYSILPSFSDIQLVDPDAEDSPEREFFNASLLLESDLRVVKIETWKLSNSPFLYHPNGSLPKPPVLLDLFRPAASFFALQAYAIAGFVLLYSLAFGVAFHVVDCWRRGAECDFLRSLRRGSRLGLRRAPAFLLLSWVLRDTVAQLLSVLYLSESHGGPATFLDLFLKIKILPSTKTALLASLGLPSDQAGFVVLWCLLDTTANLASMVVVCVAVMRRGRGVLEEAYFLLCTAAGPAILVNCLEDLACKDGGRWALTVLGSPQWLAEVIQSVAEVYFMVVWFLFYLKVRSQWRRRRRRI